MSKWKCWIPIIGGYFCLRYSLWLAKKEQPEPQWLSIAGMVWMLSMLVLMVACNVTLK